MGDGIFFSSPQGLEFLKKANVAGRRTDLELHKEIHDSNSGNKLH